MGNGFLLTRLWRLNSTMVRFKLVAMTEAWSMIYESQFHYGSIQINIFFSNKSNLFVKSQFHYGSIQIILSRSLNRWPVKVSIPLWFDSNLIVRMVKVVILARLNSTMVRFKWYNRRSHTNAKRSQFHYGSIQISVLCCGIYLLYNSLNSTMVRFKLIACEESQAVTTGLNSTMVRFKSISSIKSLLTDSVSISLWFDSN